MSESTLPLLPLIVEDIPAGLMQAFAQEGVPYRRRDEGAGEGRFVLFDSRRGRCGSLKEGQQAIDVDRLREGWDEDPFSLLMEERSQRHCWEIAGLTLVEEIARVDRRAVRQKVLQSLREAIEQAGGIWLCVSAFPFPHRSAFNFRIDHDQHEAADFEAVLQAIRGNEQATSHFVNGAAYVAHGDALRRLEGMDVGSHGYWHHTYATKEENEVNIGRGIEALRLLGIEPSGFVAPHGRFHRGLLEAMESLGIGHSSEFGLAYDDLPFFPEGCRVLQIPVHPVCLGLFLDAVEAMPHEASSRQHAVRAAIDYYRETARSKYRTGEPVFFYCHPAGRLGRYPQVLSAVMDTADSFAAVWKTSYSGFAAWWRARAAVQVEVVQQDDRYLATGEGLPEEYRLGVEYWRGPYVARMPLGRNGIRFSPSALAYENRSARPMVRPVRIDRPEGLRGRIRRWVDWERETPIDEISTRTWRNWAKRTLRRWRA